MNRICKAFILVLALLSLLSSCCLKGGDAPQENASNEMLFSTYISFSEELGILEIVEKNPIDTAYLYEMEKVYATYDIRDIIAKYTSAWKNEIKNAYSILNENLEEESQTELKKAQDAWDNFVADELNFEFSVLVQAVGYGTGHYILVERKLLDNTRLRAFALIECVFLLQGSYEFVWNE